MQRRLNAVSCMILCCRVARRYLFLGSGFLFLRFRRVIKDKPGAPRYKNALVEAYLKMLNCNLNSPRTNSNFQSIKIKPAMNNNPTANPPIDSTDTSPSSKSFVFFAA